MPKLPNVNLLLGGNGAGKTALLKAVSLAALGPAVGDCGIFPFRLIRQMPGEPNVATSAGRVADSANEQTGAEIEAEFIPHSQDKTNYHRIESRISIIRRGDLEKLEWAHPEEKLWHPIFSSSSDAFFFVGYGATRRSEKQDKVDLGSRKHSSFVRAQRIQSLFEEAYSLIPLNAWLPEYRRKNPGRYKQITDLLNKLLKDERFTFTGKLEDGEYIFKKNTLQVPFPAMSDGYRAFLSWVGDLLYHVCMTTPSGKKLMDNCGIVMVDEIDLHLHPKWQMKVLPTLAKALPNIQFIFTSHSPLVVGSLEWMNIIQVRKIARDNSSIARRVQEGIHGLDADQILLTDLFGLKTTRASGKVNELRKLTLRAREGDEDAARELLEAMSKGMEPPFCPGQV